MVRRTVSARAFIMVLSSRHSFIWNRTPLFHKQIFHKSSFIYYNLLDCKNQGRGTYELSKKPSKTCRAWRLQGRMMSTLPPCSFLILKSITYQGESHEYITCERSSNRRDDRHCQSSQPLRYLFGRAAGYRLMGSSWLSRQVGRRSPRAHRLDCGQSRTARAGSDGDVLRPERRCHPMPARWLRVGASYSSPRFPGHCRPSQAFPWFLGYHGAAYRAPALHGPGNILRPIAHFGRRPHDVRGHRPAAPASAQWGDNGSVPTQPS